MDIGDLRNFSKIVQRMEYACQMLLGQVSLQGDMPRVLAYIVSDLELVRAQSPLVRYKRQDNRSVDNDMPVE